MSTSSYQSVRFYNGPVFPWNVHCKMLASLPMRLIFTGCCKQSLLHRFCQCVLLECAGLLLKIHEWRPGHFEYNLRCWSFLEFLYSLPHPVVSLHISLAHNWPPVPIYQSVVPCLKFNNTRQKILHWIWFKWSQQIGSCIDGKLKIGGCCHWRWLHWNWILFDKAHCDFIKFSLESDGIVFQWGSESVCFKVIN
jgi:hypothetical protein